MGLQHSSPQVFLHLAQLPLRAAPLAPVARVPAGNAVPSRRKLHRELPRPPGWKDTCTCTESQGWDLGNLLPLFPCGNGDLAKIQAQPCTASAQPLHGGEMQVFLGCCSILHCSRGALLPPTLSGNSRIQLEQHPEHPLAAVGEAPPA